MTTDCGIGAGRRLLRGTSTVTSQVIRLQITVSSRSDPSLRALNTCRPCNATTDYGSGAVRPAMSHQRDFSGGCCDYKLRYKRLSSGLSAGLSAGLSVARYAPSDGSDYKLRYSRVRSDDVLLPANASPRDDYNLTLPERQGSSLSRGKRAVRALDSFWLDPVSTTGEGPSRV